jgi:chemotaxis signal transduction protein
VVDIRYPLGLKMPPFDEHARVVVVETGGISTGVAVEEVREIISVSAEKIMPLARMIADRDFMPGQIELEGEIIVLLDMEKILRAKDFQVNA